MNTVQPGSFLTLHYRLAGPDGADVVNTFADKPATLSLGTGELAPGVEAKLIGLAEGTRHSFELPAGAAFGDRSPELMQRVNAQIQQRRLHSMDELIEQAVAASNAAHPGRFIWVKPGIKPDNSAFAPHPWVFGVKLPHVAAEDDLAADRRAQCMVQPDPDRRAYCLRASAGHPNRWGARAYFNAIYPVLQREYGL